MNSTAPHHLAQFLSSLALGIMAFGATAGRAQVIANAAPDPSPDPAILQVAEREMAEARAFYDHAEYGLAWRLCGHLLKLDPKNEPAARLRQSADALRDGIDKRNYPDDPATPGGVYPANPQSHFRSRPNLKAEEITPDFITVRKSQTIILSGISFREVPLVDAVDSIRESVRRLDRTPAPPKQRGLTISFSVPTGGNECIRRDPPAASATVSLELGLVSVEDALAFVAQQASRRVAFIAGGISLVADRADCGNGLQSQTFRTWPDLFATLSEKLGAIPSSYIIGAGPIKILHLNARPYLEPEGIAFPDGSYATFYGGHQIVVCSTPENLDKMEVLVDQSPEQSTSSSTLASP